MRNVVAPAIPLSLSRNSGTWIREGLSWHERFGSHRELEMRHLTLGSLGVLCPGSDRRLYYDLGMECTEASDQGFLTSAQCGSKMTRALRAV